MAATAAGPVRRYLSIGAVAREVNRSETRLRVLERAGLIPPAGRLDGTAMRIYLPEDVPRIRQALAALPRRREQAA